MVLAHQLYAALHGFRAGVGEETGVGKGRRDQALGQALAPGNAEKIGGMPESSPLLLQRLDEVGMAVTQRGHGNTAGEIEITIAVAGEEIGAFPPLESEV